MQPVVVLRLLLLEPQHFGSGIPRTDAIADGRDDRRLAADAFRQYPALRGGLGITPKLGRTNHLSLVVQGHQAVLLAGNTNGF